MRTITKAQLETLLSNDVTAEQAAAEYLKPVETGAFKWEYRLQDDVELLESENLPPLEPQGGAAIAIFNQVATAGRRNRYRKMLKENPGRRRYVSEGDSWFQHPLVTETIDHLMGTHDLAIYPLDAAGDTLEDMMNQNNYIKTMQKEGTSVLLLSGGGNDLMGDQFGSFLNQWTPDDGTGPARLLKSSMGMAMTKLFNFMRTIFNEVELAIPGGRVFVHCYDYPLPGTGPASPRGKWLGRPMEQHNITNPAEKNAVLNLLIERFAAGVKKACSEFPNTAVFVDTRNSVSEAHRWHDEIHLDGIGFGVAANRWHKELRDRGLA